MTMFTADLPRCCQRPAPAYRSRRQAKGQRTAPINRHRHARGIRTTLLQSNIKGPQARGHKDDALPTLDSRLLQQRYESVRGRRSAEDIDVVDVGVLLADGFAGCCGDAGVVDELIDHRQALARGAVAGLPGVGMAHDV